MIVPKFIDFPCPACGKALSVKPAMAGRKGQCPGCHAHVPVPGAKLAIPVNPSAIVAIAGADEPPVYAPGVVRVHLVDADMPFGSMMWFVFKWTLAAAPTAILLGFLAWLGALALAALVGK